MIKAEELRIGNYYDHTGHVNEVNPSKIEEVCISERSWVKPIELTDIYLIRFGFEFKANKWVKYSHNEYENVISISQHKDLFSRKHLSFSFDTNGCRNMNSINIDIKYVHQLQNLYFALTGVELELSSNGI